MGDVIEYRNGQKNNWRRTAWNLCTTAVRLVRQPRDALVLYLPGEQDLDRQQALLRGYKDANLIAVEKEKAVAKKLRTSGRTVIHGDLLSVMSAWPQNHPVDLIFADLQCGLNRYAQEVLGTWMLNPPLSKAVLLVNLQRGRDEEVRSFLDYSIAHPEVIKAMREVSFCPPDLPYNHRGFLAAMAHKMQFLAMIDRLGLPQFEHRLKGFVRFLPGYRSTPGAPFMDTVVMMTNGGGAGRWEDADKKTHQQIVANLAIRTRRLSGQLSGTL